MERMPNRRSVPITRTAISPRLATSTVSNSGVPARGVPAGGASKLLSVIGGSHPEDAERGVRQGFGGADVQGEAEHSAGVGGVDDAVVPEPGGGIIWVALGFVLLAD